MQIWVSSFTILFTLICHKMMQIYLDGDIKKIVKSEKAKIAFDSLKNWILVVQFVHLGFSM